MAHRGNHPPNAFPPPFYRWRPHPWHGLEPGRNPPEYMQAYIEITPFDLVKYESSKTTGYLRVDRPQRSSSQPPALYGFIPRTYCGDRVTALSPKAKVGDGDPLDVCVISERPINRADILVNTHVIGGLQCVDGDEADDKIVAVIENDNMYADVDDINDLPSVLIERLRHYFGTYKMVPGGESEMSVEATYGYEHAMKVIEASLADYQEAFGQ
ncbi:MAG: inorganic pyrophosphatase [Planctomycetota bacterium]